MAEQIDPCNSERLPPLSMHGLHVSLRDMIRIKDLNPAEWETYRSIRLSALKDAPDAFGSTLETELAYVEVDWRKRLERNDCKTFVAFTDDSLPVGVIVGAPYDDEAGLYAMWVDPTYRRLGIGSALVDAVIRWSKENGFSRIFLDVADTNESAVGLYQSRGFMRTGTTGSLPHPREHIPEHQRSLTLNQELTNRRRQSREAGASQDA